jgi:acylphosphatase
VTEPVTRLRVRIRGVVQGVGFRWATQREAERLGLSGWVRNLFDGTVECEIEGPAAEVERMLDWLGHGPDTARVDAVEATEIGATGASEFQLRG